MITIKKILKLQGKCPVCKTKYPITGNANIQFPILYVTVECPTCGFNGFEWYDMDYTCTTGEIKNENKEIKIITEFNLN